MSKNSVNVRAGDFLFVSCFNQYVEVIEVIKPDKFKVSEIFFDPLGNVEYLSTGDYFVYSSDIDFSRSKRWCYLG